MKKRIGNILFLCFIALLVFYFTTFSLISTAPEDRVYGKTAQMTPAQDSEKESKTDTYAITLLKQIREKIEAWLKSLNEEIEREDVTRFKVRFYEVLRNILEWIKEKIDKKIESSEEQEPQKKDKSGLFQDTHQRVFPFLGRG